VFGEQQGDAVAGEVTRKSAEVGGVRATPEVNS
jgi:hypothetical protein